MLQFLSYLGYPIPDERYAPSPISFQLIYDLFLTFGDAQFAELRAQKHIDRQKSLVANIIQNFFQKLPGWLVIYHLLACAAKETFHHDGGENFDSQLIYAVRHRVLIFAFLSYLLHSPHGISTGAGYFICLGFDKIEVENLVEDSPFSMPYLALTKRQAVPTNPRKELNDDF